MFLFKMSKLQKLLENAELFLSSVSGAITSVGAERIWTPAISRQIPSSSYLLEAAVLAFGFYI